MDQVVLEKASGKGFPIQFSIFSHLPSSGYEEKEVSESRKLWLWKSNFIDFLFFSIYIRSFHTFWQAAQHSDERQLKGGKKCGGCRSGREGEKKKWAVSSNCGSILKTECRNSTDSINSAASQCRRIVRPLLNRRQWGRSVNDVSCSGAKTRLPAAENSATIDYYNLLFEKEHTQCYTEG